MPVSLAALGSFLNLCLLARSFAVRDDRRQSDADRCSVEKRHRVKRNMYLLLFNKFSERISERDGNKEKMETKM